MAGNRLQIPIFTALDINGATIPRARMYFYVNNTTTPKDTWSDIDLENANDWPVQADGSGRFTQDIFGDTSPYRIKLCDENDVQIWLKDDCNTFNGTNSSNSFPFPGAVIEFYGSQDQLDVATAALWYLMDGNNTLPNLNNKYTKTCISVGAIGTTGGTITPTGTVEDHILITSELPSHFHFIANTDSTTAASANITDTTYATKKNTGSGASNNDYALNGTSTLPTVGKSSSTGGNSGHSHVLTMNAFQPEFYQLIKLVYLGY